MTGRGKKEADQMEIKWENGFALRVSAREGAAVLSGNREGLLSLANLLTALAGETPGSHVHLDAYNSLEDGSAELILEKI